MEGIIINKLHCSLQIRLAKENIFFGPGVLTLLKLTGRYESLSAASKSMDMSYSKAYKMIKGAEKELGFKLLNRKIGGANGGGSTLTPECTDFLNLYEKFDKETKKNADMIFTKYLSRYT